MSFFGNHCSRMDLNFDFIKFKLTVKSIKVSLLDSNTKNSSTDTHEKHRQSDQGMSRANPILDNTICKYVMKYQATQYDLAVK